MPINAARRKIAGRASYGFYKYGLLFSSIVFPVLIGSVLVMAALSLPMLQQAVHYVYQQAIPSSLSMLDGQFWHQSPFVYLDTPDATTSSTQVLVKQLRITNLQQTVDQDVLLFAHDLYQRLLTTTIPHPPASLHDICVRVDETATCLAYSPHLYWPSRADLAADHHWMDTVNHHYQSHSPRRSFPSQQTHTTIALPRSNHSSYAPRLVMQPSTVFGNLSVNNDEITHADTVLLTLFLRSIPGQDIDVLWDKLWLQVFDSWTKEHNGNVAWWYAMPTDGQTWYYKVSWWPFISSRFVQTALVTYTVAFYLLSNMFAKSSQVKSHYLVALAALCVMSASASIPMSLLQFLGYPMLALPCYLCILVPAIASLENVFLLTNAVLDAGCDMQVKQKVSRGLQSVGVPMTTMLLAELVILSIGSAMESPMIQEFCLYSKTVLLVDYVLQLTFFTAVLSIDIRRVELMDLDDRQKSKRLHALSNCDANFQQVPPDFCPIHDQEVDGVEGKTCGECKDFKTHRTYNVVLLCVILLVLGMMSSMPTARSFAPFTEMDTSKDLWRVISQKNSMPLSTNSRQSHIKVTMLPPVLVIYNNPVGDLLSSTQSQVDNLIQHYKSAYQSSVAHCQEDSRRLVKPPSLLRSSLVRAGRSLGAHLSSVNLPYMMLCLVSAIMFAWLLPSLRHRWLSPLIDGFDALVTRLDNLAWPSRSSSESRHTHATTSRQVASNHQDYDADGMHKGAISAQEQFDLQQKSSLRTIQIKTLKGQHASDLRRLCGNGKHGTVLSCDQDGRLVLWDAVRATWMARLDRLEFTHASGGAVFGDLNRDYYRLPLSSASSISPSPLCSNSKKRLFTPSIGARLLASEITMDKGSRWAVAPYDNGVLRVWNVQSGNLAWELDTSALLLLHPDHPSQPKDLAPTAADLHHVTIYPTNRQAASSSVQSDLHQGLRQRKSPVASISSVNGKSNGKSTHLNSPLVSLTPSHSTISSSTTTTTLSTSSGLHQQQKQSSSTRASKRPAFVHFVGAVAEYCHPLVAELAAQQHSAAGLTQDPHTSQNFLISVYQNGMLCEWDLTTGECIQSFWTGHAKAVTVLHVDECKAPHRKLGVTWVFTAGKDGVVKCWERRLVKEDAPLSTPSPSMVHSNVSGHHSPPSCGSVTLANPTAAIPPLVCTMPSPTTSTLTPSTTPPSSSCACASKQDAPSACCSSPGQPLASSKPATCRDIQGCPSAIPYAPTSYSTSWTCLYTIQVSDVAAVTSVATALPVGGMGVLVCGTSQGAVKCFNFESGQAIATLSAGHHGQSPSDHHVSISHLAVTRYCDADTGPGLCRGCDTCFGNGFFIASSSKTDEPVHVWRLERSGANHDSSCKLCSKDYRQPYRRTSRKAASLSNDTCSLGDASSNNDDDPPFHRRKRHERTMSNTSSCPSTPANPPLRRVRRRPHQHQHQHQNQHLAPSHDPTNLFESGLLDIEQLASNDDIDLTSVFLGIIPNSCSTHLVFCDNMILAGVQRLPDNNRRPRWEAWFASLQYQEPATDGSIAHIPVDVFDLDDGSTSPTPDSAQPDKQRPANPSLWSRLFFSPTHATNAISPRRQNSNDSDSEDDREPQLDEKDDDTLLPFSTIHQVVPMDGLGLACDYGNFIKVLCLDDTKFAARRRQQQSLMSGSSLPAIQEKLLHPRPAANTHIRPKNALCDPSSCKHSALCGGTPGNCDPPSYRPARPPADCSIRSTCSRASDCSS
ncbi:hypothetical protein DM01DRAFT_1407570 [Hesseltinella vesiculosa]|uniref:Sterol regulatory element-binding protein cleavage-activating protein n=1 Tax=Hesseltinella vesiculosa TaxID=101127 RepID=A0A1X2GHT8_9FUNG|nr:hypothetical protein DM01DRAFT_1407570 [Hesseltinella vesiculosa]